MPPKTRQRRNQREVSVHTEHSHAESAVNAQGQDPPQPPPSDPNREAPPTNLLLELIQNLQQNQNVANLLKQEREKNPKEPRLFVRKPPYPTELLKQPYPEKYVAPTFSRFDGRKGSALVHISKFIDSMEGLCLAMVIYASVNSQSPLMIELIHGTLPCLPADCWTLRRKFHEKIQDGTLELPQVRQKVNIDPFLKHKEKGAVSVVIHGSASDVDTDEPVAANSAMTPTAIKTLQRNPSTIQAAEISQKKIQGAPMEIKGFGGVGEYTKGHIQACSKDLGCTNTSSSPPTYHQCVKGRLNGKPIRIAANSTPFDQSESHFVEAALYDETTPAGEASLAKPIGIPLPKWEEIKDAPEADLRDLLERKKKRKAEASTSKSQPQCPSCLTVNATDVPESADTAEAATADPKISAKEELEVINLSSDPNVHRPVSISASLSVEERMHLVELLKEYQDVFAWQYDEMPGIDPKLVAHSLNVEPGTRPVVQPMRTFHPEVEAQITQEVKKLLSAGFIKPIQHPRWLSNIVPVKKKNAAGHAMFSFMDGFSGYNQIFMSPRDAEKTAFRTPIGNFYYTVMPFGLKNAGATYQRTMTAMFHDMMHREIEDYVDDIVVKSKTREDHFGILKKVFKRCRLYKLKMNPLKCAFGVSAGKFLGFLVHQRGIDVDPARASAIATMKPPTTHKELKSFLGKLSYIRRFIPGLAALNFLGKTTHSFTDEVPGEINEVFLAGLADSVWTLKFDGSSTATSAGAGIVLCKDDGEAVTKSFKFDFPCSNNAAEYEAYLAGLAIAYEMGIKHLRVIGDSNLVVCQARGEFSLREPSLAPYRALAQKLEAKFSTFEIEHAQRNENRYADALATLGSQITFEGEEMDVTICKKMEPITESLKKEFEELSSDQEDWRAPIKAKLMSPAVAADLREIKDYTLISGDLYRRLPGGVLARCISIEEAKERLPEVHEKTCGDGGAISLYRRLQRLGYFWPNMSAEAAEIQSRCPTCQFHYSNEEVCATFVSTDWRTPFLEYLLEGILPSNPKDVYRLKRLALRYFVEGGTLFRKGFHGEPLRCLSLSESQMVMKETHAGECGEHQGKKRLYQCLLTLGYYWPTMKKDAADFISLALSIRPPVVTFGFLWLPSTLQNGIEAILLRKATGAAVANFIREHIITRFGIPYKLITDNGTPFINKDVREVLEHYQVKHRHSTPYYPQGNGQAEGHKQNMSSGHTKVHPKQQQVLRHFHFVYGTNTISPTELVVPSPRVMQGSKLEVDANMCAEARMADLEGLDEARDLAKAKSQRNYQKMANVYSKALRVRIFAEGQMVLKAAEFVRRNLPSPSKFSPNWDGPYII
uniref:Uncharacterized protein n=1 Tax=Fagus sylvatica TaxID=28930 RepID=A0A2N9GPS6_FAGSY